MSQADIDALIAGQSTPAPGDGDEPAAALTDPAEAAGDPPAEAETPVVRTWSASATTETKQLAARLESIEARIETLETVAPPAASTLDQGVIDELRSAVAQVSATVHELTAALQQLTQQSQASLGFDAQQTFDCPECGSHGTIAVPVSCTNCGHEADWGFWPDQ